MVNLLLVLPNGPYVISRDRFVDVSLVIYEEVMDGGSDHHNRSQLCTAAYKASVEQNLETS